MSPTAPPAGSQQRPDWLPEGVSVVEHVLEAMRRQGPPAELDDPDTDWDWDAGNLVAEAWRLGCIPEADMHRAMGARGENKPFWWKELKAASGDSLYIRDDPAITMAAASGALGERALSVYNDLAAKGLI
ncbi:MAG: hypothetical protein OXT07_16800 [bacterium]|nr:hypothetical protein [bacterium]